MKKQVKETYEKEAEVYDETSRIFEKGRFAYRERKLLAELLNKQGLVLFLACGIGRHFKFVINRLGCEIVGIDISVNMIKIAKNKVADIEDKQKLHLVVADVEHLPFRENIFDSAVCSRAFYLFIDKFKVLEEAYRVLKKGKTLAISSIFKDLLLTRLGIRAGLLGSDPKQFPYTSKQLAHMFRKAGFRSIQRKCIVSFTGEFSFLPRPLLSIINRIEDRLQGGRWVMVIGEKS
ncbi:MAG: methyltransferase domain-containing protein [Nitrososphaeria archaeon]